MVHLRGPMVRVSLAFSLLPRRPGRPGPASPVSPWGVRGIASGAALLLLGLALGAGGATADEPAEAGSADPAKLEAQCTEEAGRLCPDLRPGRPFVVRCLRTHSSELSATCTDYLKYVWKRAEVRFDELRGACSDELGQLCPEAGERLGEAVRCLGRHRDQLSEGCQAELSRPRDSGADLQPESREKDGADPAVNGADPS